MTITLFFLGAAVGSFSDVVVTRGLAGQSIRGRSRCSQCRQQLHWYELVPVVSFLALRGRCRACGKKLSWELLVMELATGGLFVLVGLLAPSLALLLYWLIAISFALILFLYDYKGSVLPDSVTIPWGLFVLVASLLMPALGYTGWLRWDQILLGGVIGGAFFFIQYAVSRGRWVGDGDIRLGVIMGLMLGWPYILVSLLLAYCAGAAISLILLAARQVKLSSAIPFGIFLLPALFITLWWGSELVNWYISLW